jgi:phosphate/sulfate permease
MSKTKWLIYTVLLGLTPMLGRILIYFVSTTSAKPVNVGDIIAFGLVLVITNINLLEHDASIDRAWKTRSIGLSIVLAVLMGIMFAAMCFEDAHPTLVSERNITLVSSALSLACMLFSYSVIDRITAVSRKAKTDA